VERVEIWYSGRVQRVGFRYQARCAAAGRDVSGSVRNLSDGRVHLVLEGEPAEIAAVLAGVESALGHHIEDRQRLSGPATGVLRGFQVLR